MFEVGYNGEVGTEQERWAQTGIGTSEVTFHSQDYTGWANARPSSKVIAEFEEDDPRLNTFHALDVWEVRSGINFHNCTMSKMCPKTVASMSVSCAMQM